MNFETKYIIALTNLYGLVHKDKVVDIYNEQCDEKIISITNYDKEVLEENNIKFDGQYFVVDSVMNFGMMHEIIEEQSKNDFYLPKQEELLNYVDKYYVERNEQYNSLIHHLEHNYALNDESVKIFISELVSHIRFGFDIFSLLVESVLGQVDNEDAYKVGEFIELCIDFASNLRLWSLSGNTHMQVTGEDKDIMGHYTHILDEECSCGSKKKFKDCCLLLEIKYIGKEANLEEEKVENFFEDFECFLSSTIDMLELGYSLDEGDLRQLYKNYVDVYSLYGEMDYIIDDSEYSSFIILLWKYFKESFGIVAKDGRRRVSKTKFKDVIERILSYDSDYSYSSSRLFNVDEWDKDDKLSCYEMKVKYCETFVDSFVSECNELKGSILSSSDISSLRTGIINKYIEDFNYVCYDYISLLDLLIFINYNLQRYNLY